LNRRNLNLELLGPGANGESYNLYLTNGTEHSDINTIIQHRSADSTSQQIAKGILDGDSKGIFTGKIHIHPQAQRVASGQLNKNLLLSKKAQSHSQPQLEIFADDVKCSHGSTTGQLSDDEVFYFQARGIPAEKARTLLAHGFGLEIVLKIKDKTIRHKAESLVMESLKTKFELGGAK
jgi:Fe-S cluster assembly protein SufD